MFLNYNKILLFFTKNNIDGTKRTSQRRYLLFIYYA